MFPCLNRAAGCSVLWMWPVFPRPPCWAPKPVQACAGLLSGELRGSCVLLDMAGGSSGGCTPPREPLGHRWGMCVSLRMWSRGRCRTLHPDGFYRWPVSPPTHTGHTWVLPSGWVTRGLSVILVCLSVTVKPLFFVS